MNKPNIPKEICWDILRATMLSFEGADPKAYGFDPEISRIGKNLANALFKRSEKLIQEFKKSGKLMGGDKGILYWRKT